MRPILEFARDRRGVAGVEMAFVGSIVVVLLVLGVDGWQRSSQMSDMRTAMHTGVRYYETGGSDDAIARAAATAAWGSKPADGALAVTRSCMCGSTPVDCTATCGGTSLPSVFITLSATGTYSGLMQSHALSQSDVVRVR